MKYSISVFLLLFFLLASSVYSEETVLPFKQISAKISQALCLKMDQCAKEEKIPYKYCVVQMETAFQENYAGLPADKKIKINQSELDQCTKQIKASTCEKLKNAQTISGCEFIEKLSSS